MPLLADIITRNASIIHQLGLGLIKDIPDDRFARMPPASPAVTPGATDDQVAVTNHPAFVLGHLVLYPARVATILGRDADALAVPEGYAELFDQTAVCTDDPAASTYPPAAEIKEHYARTYPGFFAMLKQIPEDVLAKPTEDDRRRERFPTLGDMAAFLAGPHHAYHLGQISTWRRVMGMGPVM